MFTWGAYANHCHFQGGTVCCGIFGAKIKSSRISLRQEFRVSSAMVVFFNVSETV